jgi:hypothetical protein
MRVLVRWTDLTQAQRDGRRLQLQVRRCEAGVCVRSRALTAALSCLQAARQAAADAGAARDVATLTAELEYEARRRNLRRKCSLCACNTDVAPQRHTGPA